MTSKILLNDGTSGILLTDGTSYLLLNAEDFTSQMAAGSVTISGLAPVYGLLWSMTVGVITLSSSLFSRVVSSLRRIFFGLSPTSDIITGAAPTGTIKAAAAPTEDIEFLEG